MPADTDDVLKKLKQIKELSEFAVHESAFGHGKEEIRLVIGLADYLITEIEVTWSRPR